MILTFSIPLPKPNVHNSNSCEFMDQRCPDFDESSFIKNSRYFGSLVLSKEEKQLFLPDVPRVGVRPLEHRVLGKVVDHRKPARLVVNLK